MGLRPYNARTDLNGALDRDKLDRAILVAREVGGFQPAHPLATAFRLLSLVAAERTEQLQRLGAALARPLITETPGGTIGRAAEVACSLADAEAEPLARDSTRRGLSSPLSRRQRAVVGSV